ncbi:uncharacterized protein [Typha angustifolia]|uniref:uncharacterized protein n=1 Tax=Typha angustifolia TaxID=59011 RepID=UPI003C2BE089
MNLQKCPVCCYNCNCMACLRMRGLPEVNVLTHTAEVTPTDHQLWVIDKLSMKQREQDQEQLEVIKADSENKESPSLVEFVKNAIDSRKIRHSNSKVGWKHSFPKMKEEVDPVNIRSQMEVHDDMDIGVDLKNRSDGKEIDGGTKMAEE